MTKTLLVALEKYSRSCLRNTWRMGKVLRIWSIWKLQLSLLTFPDYSSNFTSYVDTCTSQEAKWYFPSNPRYWADLKVLIEIIEDGGGEDMILPTWRKCKYICDVNFHNILWIYVEILSLSDIRVSFCPRLNVSEDRKFWGRKQKIFPALLQNIILG